MINGALWVLSSMIVAALNVAGVQKAPLLSQTFKDSNGGWMSYGQSVKLAVSHDSAITQPEAGALKLDYAIAKGENSVLTLPATLGSWTAAKSFKFRIRTDATTMLAISLQEQDGGRYVAMVQTPKDAWQTIELSTFDFILAQDANDPKDPDGKLDMDRVTGIAISDVSQFLIATDNAMLQSLFDIKKGNHAMYLDSFMIGTEPIPAGSASVGEVVQLETFAHPQLFWIGLGGAKLSQTSGKPLEGPTLKADYRQSPGKFVLLNRPLPSWILTGSKTLSFDVASAQPTKLLVQLEQYDGGKYNMTIDVPGGSMPQHKKLLLSGFNRGDDSTDTDTKLHLAQVKSLLIIDLAGMVDQADHDNTIWINHILASPSAG